MKQVLTYVMVCDVDPTHREEFASHPGAKPGEFRGHGPGAHGWRWRWHTRADPQPRKRLPHKYKMDVCPTCAPQFRDLRS